MAGVCLRLPHQLQQHSWCWDVWHMSGIYVPCRADLQACLHVMSTSIMCACHLEQHRASALPGAFLMRARSGQPLELWTSCTCMARSGPGLPAVQCSSPRCAVSNELQVPWLYTVACAGAMGAVRVPTVLQQRLRCSISGYIYIAGVLLLDVYI